MANLIRKKQVDQTEFSGFIKTVGDANFYPSNSNPSNYTTSADLSATSGQLNVDLIDASGVLNTDIVSTGYNSTVYSDGISGFLSDRLVSSGNSLVEDINDLSGYLDSVSGNLETLNSSTSGALNTTITNTSGNLRSYTNLVSGNLTTQINNTSTVTTVDSIVSGSDFTFTGDKFFGSEITAPQINFSGVSTPSEISMVAGTNIVSVVGSNGTFMSFSETGVGSNSSSLFAVNDSAGLAYLELFDSYKLVLGRDASPAIIVSGVNGVVIMPNLPTSAGSLPAGSLYRDGSTVKIVI